MTSSFVQIFDIKKNGCTRQQDGFRCRYNFYARGEIGGVSGNQLYIALQSPSLNLSSGFGREEAMLFVPTAQGWRMPELENAIMNSQAGQINQVTGVVNAVGEAGSDAASVMTGTQN